MTAYKRMSIETFGSYLIRSHDLDPIYVMLNGAALAPEKLAKWCLAYWCCYHAGVASEAANMGDGSYWSFLEDVALNRGKRYPRGTERRHFRGDNAKHLVAGLAATYGTAWDFVDHVSDNQKKTSFHQVSRRVQSHHGFGPWIAFKIADMLERVFHFPVSFEECELEMYKDPVRGAVMACEAWYGPRKDTPVNQCVRMAVNRLMLTFGDEFAPPDNGRCVNIQEIETILCKWKSHMNGHYYPGKDTREIKEALRSWWSPVGCVLEAYLPKETTSV